MKRMIKVLFFIGCCNLVVLLCTPQPAVRQHSASHGKCPPVSGLAGDTLTYTISFSDGERREEFIGSFRSFLERYPFLGLRTDSITKQVLIRLAPLSMPGEQLSAVEPVSFTTGTIEPDGSGQAEKVTAAEMTGAWGAVMPDTIQPVAGGKIRLFTQRAGIDGTLLPLVAVDPFLPPDSVTAPLLTVVTVAPKKITLQLNGRPVDGRGRLVSALDLIEAWTGFVKQHPAEGLSLFRHVEGIREFIAGREAVIRGFGAADQKTCYLRLTQPDSLAVERIRTPRLSAGIHSRLGAYYPAGTAGEELILAPNLKSAIRRAFLDTLILSAAEDKNPILSFSLKKYDAVMLTLTSDISYARTTLEKQASLQVIPPDRYFIACPIDDEKVRRYLVSRINAGELLKNVVKAEGKPLAAIEADSAPGAVEAAPREPLPPPAGRQFRILFRKDDMVSCKVAEKLLADLSGNGVRGILAAAAITEYERALVERSYECAIGWVADRIRNDASERLRLSAIWFNDESSESKRIARGEEIPLFAIDRYLLMRKPAGLYRGAVKGIYASSQATTGAAGPDPGSR